MRISHTLVAASCLAVFFAASCKSAGAAETARDQSFRAGAAAVDVTPIKFPVIVSGSFQERTATRAHDRLMSRALVLDDGTERLAMVVVDNLMIPRELLDQAKGMAQRETGIATDHIMISATHTHSAPSVMGCLGSRADPDYTQFLPPRHRRKHRAGRRQSYAGANRLDRRDG